MTELSWQPAWVLFSELDGAMVPREVYADRASAEQALFATALPSPAIVLMLPRGEEAKRRVRQ